MTEDIITFSFGQNWSDYLATVAAQELEAARTDLAEWLGSANIERRTVLDIGSGSGIHALSFLTMDASSVRSFDIDPLSVLATRTLWERAGKPAQWTISQGSVLESSFMETLGQFDIVYSWGVLHHTGAMWEALRNTCERVKPGGILFISLYAKGPRYAADLALKQKYNSASPLGKRLMEYRWIANLMYGRLLNFQNPFKWNEKKERGMNVYHDLIDWLGGLPYEVAGEDEVVVFCRKMNFILERIKVKCEGACNIYVFSLPVNVTTNNYFFSPTGSQ
jgi:2-polyprenyl-6-hydroxyphenyl methylase/3-demethylubiquinone-9 3-methyltransferase